MDKNSCVCHPLTHGPLKSLTSCNLATGIVIDAFGGLRDKVEADQEALRAKCFVCSLDRTKLDHSGIGFDRHINGEHNPMHYLYFLLRIKQAAAGELSAQETYVLKEAWPEENNRASFAWLPRETTHSLRRLQRVMDEDEDATVKQRIEHVGTCLAVTGSVKRAACGQREGVQAARRPPSLEGGFAGNPGA